MFVTTPLEQFQIIPVCLFRIGFLDFSISNGTIIICFGLFFFVSLIYMACNLDGNLHIVPSRWQFLFEILYETVLGMLVDNIGKRGQNYFPFIFSVFLFVLIANVIGLVPYSFTVTSHLILTFSLALTTFVGINIICVREHGFHVFSLFLPPGSSLGLAFLLVPIELVSYIFRPISLSVRLFANMMAGHTLLKVIAGFSWSMLLGTGVIFLAHIIPLVVLVILMGLELAVACIQAYVFTILSCIYLNDALNLH
jgi:ATP synthase subunit 6